MIMIYIVGKKSRSRLEGTEGEKVSGVTKD
jgi:hypothetical protein